MKVTYKPAANSNHIDANDMEIGQIGKIISGTGYEGEYLVKTYGHYVILGRWDITYSRLNRVQVEVVKKGTFTLEVGE